MFTRFTQMNDLPHLSLESFRPDDAIEDVEYRLTIPFDIRIFGPLQVFFAIILFGIIVDIFYYHPYRENSAWVVVVASAPLVFLFLCGFLLGRKSLRLEKLRDGSCRMTFPLGRVKIFDFSNLAAMEIDVVTEVFTKRTLCVITDKGKEELVVMTGLFNTIKPELGELMLSFIASAWEDALLLQQSQDRRAEMERYIAGIALGMKTDEATLDAVNIESDAVVAQVVDTGEATEAVPSAGRDLETLVADLGGSYTASGSSVDGKYHLRLPVYFSWGKVISTLAAASIYMVYYYRVSHVENSTFAGTLGLLSIFTTVSTAVMLLRRLCCGGYVMNMHVSGDDLIATMDATFAEKRVEISDCSSITTLFPYDSSLYIIKDSGDGFGARLFTFFPFKAFGCGLEPDVIKAVVLFLGRIAPDMITITDSDEILKQLRQFGVRIDLAN